MVRQKIFRQTVLILAKHKFKIKGYSWQCSLPNKVKKPTHKKTVLVIGVSMVKNIGASKIGRAARSKAISHSYSGATVNQLTKKFENHQSEQEFSTVIIHVGTNDLVHDEHKKVAANLENLINKVKVHTEKIAVSGTIKLYDCKLNNKKLSNITI